VFLGGVALPVAASAGHGAATGWSRYWNALAGYQFSALGGAGSNLPTRWHDFARTAPVAAEDLAVLAVIAIAGLVLLPRAARAPLLWWLGAVAVAINIGGSYWPHYYVQALPPLILAAGYAAVAVTRRGWRVVFAVAVLAPALVWMAALVPMSTAQRQRTIDYYAIAVKDRTIATAIRADTSPNQRVYVLESRADLYFLAGRQASYPYLWGKPIDKIPAAVPLLRAMLAGPDRPTVVIMATDADSVDPSGGIADALSAHYHVDRVAGGVTFLRANGAGVPSDPPPNTDTMPHDRPWP
jgi:hypothetical protein